MRYPLHHDDSMTARVNISVSNDCFFRPSSHLAVETMLKRCTRLKVVITVFLYILPLYLFTSVCSSNGVIVSVVLELENIFFYIRRNILMLLNAYNYLLLCLFASMRSSYVSLAKLKVQMYAVSCMLTVLVGAAVAQWLAHSPPTKAIRARSPTGSLPNFRLWESCCAGFLGVLPFPPPLHSSAPTPVELQTHTLGARAEIKDNGGNSRYMPPVDDKQDGCLKQTTKMEGIGRETKGNKITRMKCESIRKKENITSKETANTSKRELRLTEQRNFHIKVTLCIYVHTPQRVKEPSRHVFNLVSEHNGTPVSGWKYREVNQARLLPTGGTWRLAPYTLRFGAAVAQRLEHLPPNKAYWVRFSAPGFSHGGIVPNVAAATEDEVEVSCPYSPLSTYFRTVGPGYIGHEYCIMQSLLLAGREPMKSRDDSVPINMSRQMSNSAGLGLVCDTHLRCHVVLLWWGRGDSAARPFASRQGEPGSIRGTGVAPEFFARGNRPGRCRWLTVFLGDIPFPPGLAFRCYSMLRTMLLRVQGREAREPYGRQFHARLVPHRSYAQGVQCFRPNALLCNEVSTEQRRNARAGEAGNPREDPPTNGIVRRDSHMRESVEARSGIGRGSPWWEAGRLTAQPPNKLDSTTLCDLCFHLLVVHWLLLHRRHVIRRSFSRVLLIGSRCTQGGAYTLQSNYNEPPNNMLSVAIGCCLLEKACSYLTGPLRIRQHRHGSYVISLPTISTYQKVRNYFSSIVANFTRRMSLSAPVKMYAVVLTPITPGYTEAMIIPPPPFSPPQPSHPSYIAVRYLTLCFTPKQPLDTSCPDAERQHHPESLLIYYTYGSDYSPTPLWRTGFESRPPYFSQVGIVSDDRENAGVGETGDPRENSPTSGIVQHDSHMRKSGSNPAGNRTAVCLGGRRLA
ncbi:hypothetical protein PR048_033141 [Dryococelus australis]|uniref:Uncharacterized protein n=1 Tax=Dryococelus australis TaxID=614101 RepID=A0ABQ9G3M6_9NEOP|nr:hypothetical protein PR048_033141 [Dryococelus australis]